MKLVHTKYPSHWYGKDGTPFYTVPMKTDPSKTRDTNLTDAKKMGLLPSVSGIKGLLDKPQLTSWKIEQAILAALTLPHREGETIDERAKRVYHDSTEQVRDAAKRGHLAHKCIEVYIATGRWDPDSTVAAMLEKTRTWIDQHVYDVTYTEASLVGDGYAGRCDLSSRIRGYEGRFILDYKTRKPSQGKLRTYEEDAMQLSAYADADANMGLFPNDPVVHTGSLMINSVDDAEPTFYVWSKEDRDRYSKAFMAALELWIILKGYNPRTGETF